MLVTVIIHTAIVGFMFFFLSIVAQSVFKALSTNAAGKFLRVLFPRMFIYGMCLSFLATLFATYLGLWNIAIISTMVAAGFFINAFILTPIINKHRDLMLEGSTANNKKFKQLHFVSVAIFLSQMVTSSYIVISFVFKN